MLKQLSKLAEEEGDIDSAARYQKQLVELAPTDDESERLANLYARGGNVDDAQAVWSKLAAGKSGSLRAYKAIDDLLSNRKPEPVVEITESMIRQDPGDWEALYRSGVALARARSPTRRPGGSAPCSPSPIATTSQSAAAKARARFAGH